MGKVSDKLIGLEESGIIEWSNDLGCYVSTADKADPVPFELDQYLFDLHRKQEEEKEKIPGD